jgi:hypothetical protein
VTVIQFPRPRAKNPRNFGGMNIKIDVKRQRESWDSAFTSVQTALRFCNVDHLEAERTARTMIDLDILDETGARWAESAEYLESIAATMKAALARLEIAEVLALRGCRRAHDAGPRGMGRAWPDQSNSWPI